MPSVSTLRLRPHCFESTIEQGVFGIPFLCDLGLSSNQVTHHILQSAVEGYKRKRALPDSEMKQVHIPSLQYLAMVSEWPVKLTHQASQLIRSYFVASRRLRPDCLPVGAINTITSLSEAHARLAMHSTVSYDDVLAILYLYEESMAAMFGPCYIAPPLTTAHYDDKPLYVKLLLIAALFVFLLNSDVRRIGLWQHSSGNTSLRLTSVLWNTVCGTLL
ncbi:unnamed protein product [Timema podura]|uniref:MCM AAA-lid domain-containing protein n=1 Tax=Timema podura TaxID=61482 RepID=A0ABN7NSE4_TIMPD|nr:unnamed protein product [Timema podura]